MQLVVFKKQKCSSRGKNAILVNKEVHLVVINEMSKANSLGWLRRRLIQLTINPNNHATFLKKRHCFLNKIFSRHGADNCSFLYISTLQMVYLGVNFFNFFLIFIFCSIGTMYICKIHVELIACTYIHYTVLNF